VLALLLAALSLAEAALFAALLPSLFVAEALHDGRFAWRRLGPMAGIALFAAASARLMGGFLTSAQGLSSLHFVLHFGFCDTLLDTLRWTLQSFGVRLLLGAVGLLVLQRGRLLFGLMLAGSLVLLNTVRYAYARDIVKFAHVAGIALGVLGSAALARLFPPFPGGLSRRGAVLRELAGGTLLAAAVASSCAFLLIFAIGRTDVPLYYVSPPVALSAPDTEAVDWIRRRARPGDVVYRAEPASLGYAQWGGLPQPWTTPNARTFGFTTAQLDARAKLLAQKPADLESYRRQSFRWFVLDGSRPDRQLDAHAAAWIAQRLATVRVEFGPLRVIEILPAS
jgi:hypothetical protein